MCGTVWCMQCVVCVVQGVVYVRTYSIMCIHSTVHMCMCNEREMCGEEGVTGGKGMLHSWYRENCAA